MDTNKLNQNYTKQINLDSLKGKEIENLEKILVRLGYKNLEDYKFNSYGIKTELIITNRALHRDLKTIRRTKYIKNIKEIK